VPRYFFHFSDGTRQFTDGAGQELSGLAAVRAHATKQVREIKAAMCLRARAGAEKLVVRFRHLHPAAASS